MVCYITNLHPKTDADKSARPETCIYLPVAGRILPVGARLAIWLKQWGLTVCMTHRKDVLCDYLCVKRLL